MTDDLIFDAVVSVDKEDGGQAKIVEMQQSGDNSDEGIFVRVHSWSRSGAHAKLDTLLASGFTVTLRSNP